MIPCVSRRPRYDKITQLSRTHKRRRERIFVCFGMKKRDDLYSSSGGNINGRPFNEG